MRIFFHAVSLNKSQWFRKFATIIKGGKIHRKVYYIVMLQRTQLVCEGLVHHSGKTFFQKV